VIVVVGTPAWRETDPAGPAGSACSIAIAAAARGAAVELVGRAGDDRAGDELMIALAKARVGHVALLRDPARATPIVEGLPAADAESASVLEDESAVVGVGGGGDGAPVLEPADVDLGLRYLDGYRVIVVTDDVSPAALPVVVAAAEFGSAHLVLLVGEGSEVPTALPAAATVLAAPRDDPEADFARLVGAYAAGLDSGLASDVAFEAARGAGWEQPVA
jgi:hypothetical protein